MSSQTKQIARHLTKQMLASLAQDIDTLGSGIANAGHKAAAEHCEFNHRLAVEILNIRIESAKHAIKSMEQMRDLISSEAGR